MNSVKINYQKKKDLKYISFGRNDGKAKSNIASFEDRAHALEHGNLRSEIHNSYPNVIP